MTWLLAAIDALPLTAWLRASSWAYPVLEIVHLSGLSIMVGSVFLVEARVLGLQPVLPLPALGALGVLISVSGFALAAASGGLLLLANAAEVLASGAFLPKLVLIVAAAVNMLVFHLRGSLLRPDRWAQAQAVLSIGLWLAVIAAGRLIAYV